MLKIQLLDGTTFEYEEALETEEYYNGSSRRTMTLTCMPDAISLDKLNAALIEDNLSVITMTDEKENITNSYDGYVLKLECGIKHERIVAETPEYPAVYADRLVIKLGRRTYIEEALHKLGM